MAQSICARSAALLLLLLALVLCVNASRASEPPTPVYTIGKLAVAGSGCPPQSVEAVPSPDATSVSVIFASFEAATDANRTRSRAACSVAVPVHAQPGQSIGFFKVDFRGYVYVPDMQNASAVLSNEYFFAGQQGINVKRVYERGSDQDIFETSSINFQSIIWTPCGGSTNFRINTAITAVKPTNAAVQDDVQIVVDSMDSSVQGSIQVAVATRKCDALTGKPL